MGASVTFKLTDFDILRRAVREADVKAIVSLLESPEKLPDDTSTEGFEWADPPRTVAALAATEIATLLAEEEEGKEEEQDQETQDCGRVMCRLIEADGVPRLISS